MQLLQKYSQINNLCARWNFHVNKIHCTAFKTHHLLLPKFRNTNTYTLIVGKKGGKINHLLFGTKQIINKEIKYIYYFMELISCQEGNGIYLIEEGLETLEN